MLSTDAKEFIRLCLNKLFSKTELETKIEKLDQYLDYINIKHNDTFGMVINNYSVASPLQQKTQLKSFLDIEQFLGRLADELNLSDASRLVPLPSDIRRGNTTNLSWTLERYLKQAFSLFSSNFKLSVESMPINITKYQESSMERHFLHLYYYRNNLGDHYNANTNVGDLSFDEINSLTKSMLFAIIFIIDKYDEELQKIYKKDSKNQLIKAFDPKAYTNEIQLEYDRNRNFEYLDTKWVFDIEHTNGLTIKEIINEDYSNQIIAFIGEAGTGKTTALKRLEYEYAKKCTKNSFERLPIYIELKNLRPSDSALEKAIISRLRMQEGSAKTVIKNEALVLLLDGFNEISDKQFAASIRSEVEEILESNDKILLFITDRNNKHTQFKTIQSPFYCYLHELSIEEKMIFFKSNSKRYTSIDIINQQIVDETENGKTPIIQSLKTPYMLSVFLSYVDEYGAIPKDPIQNYLEKLFEREEKEQKDSDDPKHFEQMKNVLGALAYKYENNEFRRLDAQRIIGRIKELFAYQALDSSECLELSIKMGLIERSGENTLRFKSKEFSDFFCIYALSEGIDEYFIE